MKQFHFPSRRLRLMAGSAILAMLAATAVAGDPYMPPPPDSTTAAAEASLF